MIKPADTARSFGVSSFAKLIAAVAAPANNYRFLCSEPRPEEAVFTSF
jgi:hypothetical protein